MSVDLGDNQISKLENLDHLTSLTELFAAKNKLTSMKGIEKLTNLSVLALQAN